MDTLHRQACKSTLKSVRRRRDCHRPLLSRPFLSSRSFLCGLTTIPVHGCSSSTTAVLGSSTWVCCVDFGVPVTRLAWAHGLAYTLHRRTVSRGLPAVVAGARPQVGSSLTARCSPGDHPWPRHQRLDAMPRFHEQMTPEQQEGYRSLIETRGRLPRPNKIYVHNPKLAKVMGPLGAHFRTGYSLSEREREIAVCIITSKFHAAYPTNAHERCRRPGCRPTRSRQSRRPADLVRRPPRASRLRDGDVPRPCALGVEGAL